MVTSSVSDAAIASSFQTKLPAEQVRQTLTREYSTLRFRIEYGNYLSNYLLHAVVALHELGSSEQKIAEYAAHYSKKLEAEGPGHEDVVEHVATILIREENKK